MKKIWNALLQRRIISYLLSLVVFMSFFSGISIHVLADSITDRAFDASSFYNYHAWSQDQYPWGLEKIGKDDQYGGFNSVGCLVTAYAKISVQAGVRTPSTMNPSIANSVITAAGGLDSTGSVSNYSTAANAVGLTFISDDGAIIGNCFDANGNLIPSILITALNNPSKNYQLILRHLVRNGTETVESHFMAVNKGLSISTGSICIDQSISTNTSQSWLSNNMTTTASKYSSKYMNAQDYSNSLVGINLYATDTHSIQEAWLYEAPNNEINTSIVTFHSSSELSTNVSSVTTTKSSVIRYAPVDAGDDNIVGRVPEGTTLNVMYKSKNHKGNYWYYIKNGEYAGCYIFEGNVSNNGGENGGNNTPVTPSTPSQVVDVQFPGLGQSHKYAAFSVGSTNATLTTTLVVSGGATNADVSKVGIVLYDSSKKQIKEKEETPIINNPIYMHYDVVGELGEPLVPNTNYYYRCFAILKGSSERHYSAYQPFTTLSETPSPQNPLAPSAPRVIPNGSYVNVDWGDVSGETGYDVYLVQSPWGWENILDSRHVEANVNRVSFSGVPEGYYSVFVISRPNNNQTQSPWTGVSVSSSNRAQASVDRGQDGVYSTGENVTMSVNIPCPNYYLTIYHTPPGGATYLYWADYISSPQQTMSFPYDGYYSCAFYLDGVTDIAHESGWVGWSVVKPSGILNLDGRLDGTFAGVISDYGTADVYINGVLVADDCTDYCASLPVGTAYQITDAKPYPGYSYNGVYAGSFAGTVGEGQTDVILDFSRIDTSDIPSATNRMIYNGHTYLFYDLPVSWWTAKAYSEALGGHLVTISSEEENQFVWELCGNKYIWLGGTDSSSEGNWQWVSGESFAFTNWTPTQPDDYQGYEEGGEDYIHLTDYGTWNDNKGSTQLFFVCEIDSAPSFTISYNANGGTNAPAAQTKTQGENLTLSGERPTREGYTFLGWAESSTASEAQYQPGDSFAKDADTVLYAVWKREIITGECGDNLTWTLDEEGLLTISGTGDMWDFEPANSSPKNCAPWTNYRGQIRKIVIGEGVTSIGNSAFEGCRLITSVTIPEGVTKIGKRTFLSCYEQLMSVSLPKSVTYIGDYAFNSCWFLTSIHLGKELMTIGEYAFEGCSKLKDIHYDSTEKNWNRITIENHNGPLENAVKHFNNADSSDGFTITFDANGGTDAPETQTKTHGEALTLSSTKPTRDGYTFLGWAESSTATTAQYQPGGSYTKDADTTLYAVWKLRETEFTGSKRITSGAEDAYSVDIYCPAEETLTAYGARYSAEGQFLGFTSIALTPGQENELVIPVGDGSVIKVFVADGNSRPVCPSMTIPVD